MKIAFEGEPSKVIAEMKEYIARCGLEFTEHEEPTQVVPKYFIGEGYYQECIRNLNAKIESLEEQLRGPTSLFIPEIKKPVTAPMASIGEPQGKVNSEGKLLVPNDSKSVCRFCTKYSAKGKWLSNHEAHCKANPNHIPHKLSGKTNPGLEAWRSQKRAEKNQSPNFQGESQTQSGSHGTGHYISMPNTSDSSSATLPGNMNFKEDQI